MQAQSQILDGGALSGFWGKCAFLQFGKREDFGSPYSPPRRGRVAEVLGGQPGATREFWRSDHPVCASRIHPSSARRGMLCSKTLLEHGIAEGIWRNAGLRPPPHRRRRGTHPRDAIGGGLPNWLTPD